MSSMASIEVTFKRNKSDNKLPKIVENLCRTNLVYKDLNTGTISPLIEIYDKNTGKNEVTTGKVLKKLDYNDFEHISTDGKIQFMLQHEIDVASKDGIYCNKDPFVEDKLVKLKNTQGESLVMTKKDIEGETTKIPLNCRNEQKYLDEIDVTECEPTITCDKIDNKIFRASIDFGVRDIKSLDECQKKVYECGKKDNCLASYYRSDHNKELTKDKKVFFQGVTFDQGKCYYLWGPGDDVQYEKAGGESCKFKGETQCGTDKALC